MESSRGAYWWQKATFATEKTERELMGSHLARHSVVFLCFFHRKSWSRLGVPTGGWKLTLPPTEPIQSFWDPPLGSVFGVPLPFPCNFDFAVSFRFPFPFNFPFPSPFSTLMGMKHD